MISKWVVAGVVVTAWLVAAGPSQAQLFGKRSLGGTLSRRPRPGGGNAAPGGSDVGTLSGRERFLRRNRGRFSFVGPDTAEMRRFVGNVEGRTRGAARSSLRNFRIERGPNANRGASAAGLRRTGVYPPRLTVDFRVPRVSPTALARTLEQQLAASPSLGSLGPIAVSVEGATAILRGEVASARDAELAALVVGMEPGISRVRNELVVPAPQSLPGPARPRPDHPVPAR